MGYSSFQGCVLLVKEDKYAIFPRWIKGNFGNVPVPVVWRIGEKVLANVDLQSNGLMRIALFVAPDWLWRWQKWLAQSLRDKGHQVDLCLSGQAGGEQPAKLRLLLQLERLLYRQGGENASDLITLADFEGFPLVQEPVYSAYDLVMDLAGYTDLSHFRARRFRPLYDGMAGSADLVGLLLDGHRPRLSLDDSALSEARRFGLVAVEEPEIVLRGLDNVYSRMLGALLKSVDEIAENLVTTPPVALSGARTKRKRRKAPLKAGRFFLGTLSGKLTRRLNRLVRRGGGEEMRWGVGWRFANDHPVRRTNDLDLDRYIRLVDDGKRFYADPFVVWHEGLHHVFIEEFPFETQKGIISHFTIDEKGAVSPLKMVLSRPYHLSYPNVFKRDGQFWMIPETSSNRTVELYRAVHFPDKWVFEKTLLADIRADDVTLVDHEGRLWMFAAVSDWQSSQWDALGLFYADDLLGDWQAHQANPVLIDASAARPAGAMYHKNGVLWRPAQDCSSVYGGGLALCRVDRLDPERFEQTIMHRFAPKGKQGLIGLHTLNEDHGLEVIDFFGRL